MKVTAFILNLLVLALAMIPCSDAGNKCFNRENSVTEKTHSHGNDQDDLCSPFCICQCCGVTTQMEPFAAPDILSPSIYIHTEPATIYTITFISGFYQNIWQPPKIA